MQVHSFLEKKYSVVVHNTDISDRDAVLEQLRNFFGFENVVPISTYNRLALKSLVKDLSKFYGIPYEEANNALKTVEAEVRKAVTKHGDDKNLFVLEFDPAMEHSPSFRQFMEKYPQVAESIKILFKQNRSLGRHAGGVLIVDDLPGKMPLITNKGDSDVREPQSPFVEGVNFKSLEKVGEYIKYDLLGLETLRLIERTIELILNKQGMVEIEIEGQKYRATKSQQIKLVDGSWLNVADINNETDVAIPVEIKD